MITERTIQLALFRDLRSSCSIVCPNFTPGGWWECDVWAVTKAGYVSEYEIKLSVGDFKKDAKKSRSGRYYMDIEAGKYVRGPNQTKSELLASRDPKCPNRFFYIVPRDLVKPEDVPEYAGLVYAWERPHWSKPILSVVKAAPRLHKAKVVDKLMDRVREVFYWRFWTAIDSIQEAVKRRVQP